MADNKPTKTASPQSKDTVVETGRATAAEGEINPSADQGNRGDVIAAQMAVTPVRTLAMAKAEVTKKSKVDKTIINDMGEIEYVDPDDLETTQIKESIPTDVCLNCKNQGRDSKLDDKGFCKVCGFKLNRLRNIQLEPARVQLAT